MAAPQTYADRLMALEPLLEEHMKGAPDLRWAANTARLARLKFAGGGVTLGEETPLTMALDGELAQASRVFKVPLAVLLQRLVDLRILDATLVDTDPHEREYGKRPLCRIRGFHPSETWLEAPRDPKVLPQPGDRFCSKSGHWERELVAIDGETAQFRRYRSVNPDRICEVDRGAWNHYMSRTVSDQRERTMVTP
jgi:hypothetical protein